MKICGIAKGKTICDLPSQGTESTNEQVPKVAYCKKCFQIAFRCSSGHWNRAFARFCTQCPEKLEKPSSWEMASANPQRTAIQPDNSTVSLDIEYGFGSWAVGIPEIEPREDLPKLLAIDGLIVIPNTSSNSFDAYSIVKQEDNRQLTPHFNIELNTQLTLGNTPIYHGLHLYTVVSGGIQKTNVLDGKTELININSIDSSKIEPISTCAPLRLSIRNSPTMVAGLTQGILLLDMDTHKVNYYENEFFKEKNKPLAPALCGTYLVFTSIHGKIFTLNIEANSQPNPPLAFKDIYFSAPVTLESFVYFEALNENGNRAIARYEPVSDKTSIVVNFDNDHDLHGRLSYYTHPTLTDGKKLFVADNSGKPIYISQTDQNILGKLNTNGSNQHLLITYRSVVVNNCVYSVHTNGLSVYSQDQNTVVSGRGLAMGWENNPFPIAPPIQYGNKLFILCQDRLVCSCV